uniref:Uncharacterized protein n=1 Tax=Glossina brevipalpis TaxID=37001 RepID=A0A1A9X063_9MUSC
MKNSYYKNSHSRLITTNEMNLDHLNGTWIQMEPEKGFGYIIYDQGYDVWMGNVRSHIYSLNHTKYNTKRAKLCKFTFHELNCRATGKFQASLKRPAETPATLQFILITESYSYGLFKQTNANLGEVNGYVWQYDYDWIGNHWRYDSSRFPNYK